MSLKPLINKDEFLSQIYNNLLHRVKILTKLMLALIKTAIAALVEEDESETFIFLKSQAT